MQREINEMRYVKLMLPSFDCLKNLDWSIFFAAQDLNVKLCIFNSFRPTDDFENPSGFRILNM
jgi:hypothetical protein